MAGVVAEQELEPHNAPGTIGVVALDDHQLAHQQVARGLSGLGVSDRYASWNYYPCSWL